MDPRTLASIQLKYEIWPGCPKFDTDTRGLKQKATGLHLVDVKGTPWGAHWNFSLVGPRSRARTADPRTLVFYTIKIRNLARGSQV